MAVMLGKLYNALIEAGASADRATQAAEEIAGYDNRFAKIDTDMVAIRGELTLLRWMVGFNLAMTVAIVGKLFLAGH